MASPSHVCFSSRHSGQSGQSHVPADCPHVHLQFVCVGLHPSQLIVLNILLMCCNRGFDDMLEIESPFITSLDILCAEYWTPQATLTPRTHNL